MGRHWKQMVAATSLWTFAVAMAITGTIHGNILLMLWAVLVALVACLVTAWVIVSVAARIVVKQERLRLEHLAELMAAAARSDKVRSIR